MRYRFVVALVVAFTALSVVADRTGKRQRTVTGTVTEWRGGESIAVANEQTDHQGFTIRLRNTVYEGDEGLIKPGVRVTVWYRDVRERYPVADKVRVLNERTF
jgi:hypothetical protein